MDLNKLNGWQRLGAFTSVVWVIVASALYISVMDVFVNSPHQWVMLWYSLNPLAPFVPLFENGKDLEMGRPHFDLFGFLFFVTFPAIVLWAVGYGVAWVRKGFHSDKDEAA